MYRIVTVIQTTGDMIKAKTEILEAQRAGANMIELRVDAWEKGIPTDNDVMAIKAMSSLPMIFTFRSFDEGGKRIFLEDQRVTILKKAVNAGFEYIDIELKTVKSKVIDLKSWKNNKIQFIVSFHNFHGASTLSELRLMRDEMIEKGADICKFAVSYIAEKTNEEMLSFIKENVKDGIPIIGIVMGVKGKITRQKGLQTGSYLMYSILDKTEAEKTGQLTTEELSKI